MSNHFIKIALGFTILLQISCNNCRLVDCKPAGDTIKLRLMKDGQNALFGSNAFINRDSVTFSIQDPFIEDVIIGFSETSETMNLIVEDGLKYVLEIKNIRTDTIIGTAVVTGFGECCASYQLSKVMMNGQIICQDECSEIIEVQL